jgi:dTDP-4-amino-4,6-dideoxygalactose transaminase
MTNLHAAVFNAQWSKKDKILKNREKIFHKYFEELSKVDFGWSTNFTNRSSPWLFTIRLNSSPKSVKDILELLGKEGIETRPGFNAISELDFAKEFIRNDSSGRCAQNLASSVISLPTYPRLKNSKIEYIVKTLENAINDKL